ncbi:hypothetical protein LSH36_208g04098, partial [Paralvinella palmiformis]
QYLKVFSYTIILDL